MSPYEMLWTKMSKDTLIPTSQLYSSLPHNDDDDVCIITEIFYTFRKMSLFSLLAQGRHVHTLALYVHCILVTFYTRKFLFLMYKLSCILSQPNT